ncbi:MAG: 50S ribosomal protein L23, partial [Clostridia bacterium]|nr:50S ribosomal protein L23 [Clostridia bacterium]
MKTVHDIIIKPIITEASMSMAADKRYVFKVMKRATKPEIAV